MFVRFLHSLALAITAMAQASDEGVSAMRRFRVAPGLNISLFAAEPMLANPVAFSIDERGRFFVAETHRHSAVGPAYRYYEGVFDIRSHMDWLDDDLAARSVEDRLDLLQRRLGTNFARISLISEKVRMLEDRNGDGAADFHTIFAEGFNRPLDGIGAGVLARKGSVYYTCVPDLWLLADKNSDNKAEGRQSLHTGFGAHIGFLGHDLHGLRLGPDGRLYFSIGDRGINVTSREGKHLFYPDEGVVLRCEPDGANLEVFARGLRNPQELAFNDLGDLFTGDNNSDGGDRARWAHLVEGSDSGWRIGYQHITSAPRRGPWNAERLWIPRFEKQAAYIIPPIANLGYGPSGLAYYPGTGLPDRYKGHFFLCDFRGGASSGIHSFSLKPKGASYELDAYEQFVWECLPTDVEFGPDGAVYFSDWVESWNKTGKGRIYKISDPQFATNQLSNETKALLASELKNFEPAKLADLLAHADQRVRQEAQFALVESSPGISALQRIAVAGTNQIARLHGIWGLGQVVRRDTKTPDQQSHFALEICAGAPDPEVRAQAAKCLGESRLPNASRTLVPLLSDANPRVRMHAAISLARLKHGPALPNLITMLEENNDQDAYVRHAAVMGLAGIGNVEALREAVTHNSRAVRLAVCVALRRLGSPAVADFLNDSDQMVSLEAARAIHDLPLEEAFPKLAALLLKAEFATAPSTANTNRATRASDLEKALSAIAPEPDATTPAEQLLTRAINAHFRLGAAENAQALARFAAQNKANDSLRAAALDALADWEKPPGRDRVMGDWRPLPPRNPAPARAALKEYFAPLLQRGSLAVKLAATRAIRSLQLKEAGPILHDIASAGSSETPVRLDALKALAVVSPKNLPQALDALDPADSFLQAEALRLRAELDPATAMPKIKQTLNSPSIANQRAALSALPLVPGAEADALLSSALDRLLNKSLPNELALDALDAAGRRATPELLAKIQRFEQQRPADDPIAGFIETLHGGDAAAGRQIFFERAEVFCSRCHKINGEGGEAGPDLTGIGQRHPRGYIVESIVLPNNKIAAGWDNVLVRTLDGQTIAGKLKSETGAELIVDSPEDGEMTVKKSEIKSRERALSAMPDEFRQILTKHDIRNLVEFLATTPAPK